MFLIYSLLFTLGVIVTAPYYLWRLRGNIISGAGWRERLGFLPDSFGPPVRHRRAGAIWVHAVSVGETLAVAGLVRELQRRYPDREIFMSHVTPAGRATGESRLPAAPPVAAIEACPVRDRRGGRGGRDRENAGAAHAAAPRGAAAAVAGRFYLPLDWACSARRVIRRIRPAALIIVETELWPNLLRAAHEFGSRVVLVNARLSDRSLRGYRLFGPFMRRVLENVDCVCAQTQPDAARCRLLGVPSGGLAWTGNLKFDAGPSEVSRLPCILRKALTASARGPVVVAASTMTDEEPLVLEAWKEVRRSHPRALLVLAPRHPARFETAAKLLARSGLSFVRRTALEAADQELASQLESPQILLLNTIGELAGIFELADVVFIGGSLVPTGGHNLLEPAFSSKPIAFGPHMQNFRDIASLFLEARAAIQVRDRQELARVSLELLGDAERRRRMGETAKRLVESESGATERVLACLREYLAGAA